jgi:RimJ/RimL family protein N-acetyltransferase
MGADTLPCLGLPMQVLETQRLILRRLTAGDALFILRLVNEPGFLRFIGDRGVRSAADAEHYIQHGPVASYERFGFGLFLVELKNAEPIGICGLLQREYLPDVDIGFAFLPELSGHGYALEAAEAVVNFAARNLGLKCIVAITLPDNDRSIRLLEKLHFKFERNFRLPDDDEELLLFAWRSAWADAANLCP